MEAMKVTDIVKDNTAKVSHYRNDLLYYDVFTSTGETVCTFPIDLSDKKDIGSATFSAEHKAITLMRYIRKAIKAETIVFG